MLKKRTKNVKTKTTEEQHCKTRREKTMKRVSCFYFLGGCRVHCGSGDGSSSVELFSLSFNKLFNMEFKCKGCTSSYHHDPFKTLSKMMYLDVIGDRKGSKQMGISHQCIIQKSSTLYE